MSESEMSDFNYRRTDRFQLLSTQKPILPVSVSRLLIAQAVTQAVARQFHSPMVP